MAGELARGIAYIVLGVTDLQRSVAFYRDALGLPLQFQLEGLAFFGAGPVTLMLNTGAARGRQQIAGATELVFAVDAVKPAWRALVVSGVPFVREPMQVNDANWSAIMTDPDGHMLSVYGPPGQ